MKEEILNNFLRTAMVPIEEATGVEAMIGILPYIFVAVVILGAVFWRGSSSFGERKEKDGHESKRAVRKYREESLWMKQLKRLIFTNYK